MDVTTKKPPSPNHQILLGAHVVNPCNCFADPSPANAVSKAGWVSLHMFYLADHCYLRACFALSFITALHPPSHERGILLGDREIKRQRSLSSHPLPSPSLINYSLCGPAPLTLLLTWKLDRGRGTCESTTNPNRPITLPSDALILPSFRMTCVKYYRSAQS